VTDDDWSRTVEMLLGLDVDPYSYDDITDNSWPFKTKNRGKENEYIQFSIFSIWLACLRKSLVKNTTAIISWLTMPRHSWFGKHELRQIKYLMGDLGHPHIFTAMLASIGQYLNF
jgi:hypothetical protein